MLIAGIFASSSLEVGATTLSSADYSDGWVGQLDPAGSGSWDWALRVGGSKDDEVSSMVLLDSGKVTVCLCFHSHSVLHVRNRSISGFSKSQDSEFKSQIP